MPRRSRWIAAFFIACFALPSNAADTVLFDNLNDTQHPLGDVFITPNSLWAQSFRTTAIDSIVNAVSVKFYRGAGSTGSIAFEIWDLNSGDNKPLSPPARNVGTLDISTLSTDASNPTQVDFTTNISLNTSTDYYLVARIDSSLSGLVYWSRTDSQPSPGYSWYVTSSNDGGSSWDPTTTDPTNSQLMKITAVPEPSTYALGAIGTLVLGWLGRRRGRRTA